MRSIAIVAMAWRNWFLRPLLTNKCGGFYYIRSKGKAFDHFSFGHGSGIDLEM